MFSPEGYRYRQLTVKDLVIASDRRTARYGFVDYRLTQTGDEECVWQWVTTLGSSYSSVPFHHIERAAEVLAQTVQDLNVTVAVE